MIDDGIWGSLSTLSELQLEQLYFVCTGLSPKIHVKDLIVENKKSLQLGLNHVHTHSLTSATSGSHSHQVHLS